MSERLNPVSQFDVLGDVVETLRFRGTIFFRSALAAPWGMALESCHYPRFHIAMAGGFYVGADSNQKPIEVREMGLVMLPTGSAHWIADRPGRSLVPSEEAGKACELDKPMFQVGHITNSLMCGLVRYDEQCSHPLLNDLPDVIHASHIGPSSSMWRIIELIDSEIMETRSEHGSVVDRLTEVLFLKLLREHVKRPGNNPGFFGALHDRRLNTVLQLIHQRMRENWTIETLASQVGMSRATLVRHFHEAVGVPPIEYLTQWRLLKAYSLLKHSAQRMDDIAEYVGFASAQTLTRAFKRHYGYTPTSLRKTDVTPLD